jgi:hypothetical protein
VIHLLRPERLYRSLPQQKEGEMNQVEKAARFAELHVPSDIAAAIILRADPRFG